MAVEQGIDIDNKDKAGDLVPGEAPVEFDQNQVESTEGKRSEPNIVKKEFPDKFKAVDANYTADAKFRTDLDKTLQSTDSLPDLSPEGTNQARRTLLSKILSGDVKAVEGNAEELQNLASGVETK